MGVRDCETVQPSVRKYPEGRGQQGEREQRSGEVMACSFIHGGCQHGVSEKRTLQITGESPQPPRKGATAMNAAEVETQAVNCRKLSVIYKTQDNKKLHQFVNVHS